MDDVIRMERRRIEQARDELELLATQRRQIDRQIEDALERSLAAQRRLLLAERGQE